eukprot:CAMPEP_0119052242 /NCGR_PEP_ID=MMETSP1177-20130426/73605_1 /TAXON_ID=2985 /ORGANISM="Ochromonas sp, Strain CCMP1899" /LENGTH=112 /DNA_ID=CAMNT_0007031747 /DNA_START=512 /DNA_END=847 /DNA_ORIENTATION=-
MSEFAENPVGDEGVPDEVAAMFDLTQKKKKKKAKKVEITEGTENVEADGTVTESATTVGSSTELDLPQYSYTQLLNRVVDYLHLNNPDLIEKRRYTMKPPQLMRVGTKKTLW